MELTQLLAMPQHIVVLSGAGVSTDSGIQDYRTLDKTWPFSVPRAEMNSLPFFMQEPELFWQGYWTLIELRGEREPNTFHRSLVQLEELGHRVTVLTQNVDALHQEAGSTRVLEFHGNQRELVCEPRGCGNAYPTEEFTRGKTPHCFACGSILKPAVSLFFEGINYMAEAREALLEANLLFIAGTSLRVGPVNELPYFAHYQNPGCRQLWINREAAPDSYDFLEYQARDCSKFASELLALGL